MKCPTCAGPAYVGLLSVECINPACAPFDPRSIPSVHAFKLRGACDFSSGRVSYRAVYAQEHEAGGETFYGVDDACSASLSAVRPSREACIDAWLAENPDMVRSEPARRAARAIDLTLTNEQRKAAYSAYTGEPIDANACFLVSDWERLAWCCWEAKR